MARLIWDSPETRLYETGLDQGVLYLNNSYGIPWNGLTAVNETPDGGAVTSYYLDGVKYLNTIGGEDFKATVEAYTYPKEFEACQGMQPIQQGLIGTAQPRIPFGLSYRTKVGSAIDSDLGYKIHIVYNAMIAPSNRNNVTITDKIDANTFSWDVVATPVYIPGHKPTAHLIVDSRYADPDILDQLEGLLYGSDTLPSHLPSIQNLIDMIVENGTINITDNGDGTWTAIGPNEYFTVNEDGSFQILEANATYLDDDTYVVQSTA